MTIKVMAVQIYSYYGRRWMERKMSFQKQTWFSGFCWQ